MITLQEVSKIYGERLILKNVSLGLESGTLTLLLGANGAGKSTLMRIMANLTSPSSGKRLVQPGRKLAYVGHATFLYPELTALENLVFQARINNLPSGRNELLGILKKMRLQAFADEPVRHFSRGMMQRLNFGRAIMLEPDILLLDEPFTGLDMEATAMLKEELTMQKSQGAAIMVISHDPVADLGLASHVCSIGHGRLKFYGTKAQYQTSAASTC